VVCLALFYDVHLCHTFANLNLQDLFNILDKKQTGSIDAAVFKVSSLSIKSMLIVLFNSAARE
jgi:hypothetical protein